MLNAMIQLYLNKKHVVRSSDEVLLNIENLKLSENQQLVSLDVTSLFTNVPVTETIEIIIEAAYGNENVPPPPILPEDLRALLKICTQETPFLFGNKQYVQIDGVPMGSPLGPTFADFYMSNLENKLLAQSDKKSNPIVYLRYVDDIFAIFKAPSHIRFFVERLQKNSVLKFTHEQMKNNTFSFLDVRMEVSETGSMRTSVYTKATDTGLYTNFNSHTPENYKISIVKTLVARALRYCSTWNACHAELDRLRQVFANNGYPQNLVDKVINNKMNQFFSDEPKNEQDEINFFVQFFSISNFKSDTRRLNQIIKSHVRAPGENTQVRITPYYKPYKISALFSTRPRTSTIDKSDVVYKFTCPEARCNSTYYGYTQNSLKKRVSEHRYKASSIYQHYVTDHNMLPPQQNNLISHFEIVYANSDLISLKIAEAISIKHFKPIISVKYNVLYEFLSLF